MYVKTAIRLVGFAGSYLLASWCSWPRPWWQGLLLAILLGLAAAGIGFSIEHDGSHRAYSSSPVINSLMASTLELSSWRQRVATSGYATESSPHSEWA